MKATRYLCYRVRFCMPFQSRCIRKLAGLPDHLIRLEEEHRGDCQSEGLGGLEVEDQLKLHWLLNGQVGRLGPLQDLVHIGGRAAEEVRQAWSIAYQATGLHKFFPFVHGWQPML